MYADNKINLGTISVINKVIPIFQDEGAKPVHGKVTLKMISQWQEELQNETKVKLTTLTTVIKAFNAAMLRVTTEDGSVDAEFKVEGKFSIHNFLYVTHKAISSKDRVPM